MKLARRGIFVWHGNCFALNLTGRLGGEKSGGFLRAGLMHYNNMSEVEKVLSALQERSLAELRVKSTNIQTSSES